MKMNVIELDKFNSFILNLQISPFDNSSDCAVILTRDQLVIGFLDSNKEIKWSPFKEIDMKYHATAFAISPLSRTLLMPLLIRVAYGDKTGIYTLSFVDNSLEKEQIVLKGDFEVIAMSYNDDGMKLAFTGYDNCCHILIYQDDALSDRDSMLSDAVSEGGYNHCIINLTSPGITVRWHPIKNNYLVVSELNGTIRFLVSTISEEEKESFICEYVINIGLKLPTPLTDIDFIVGLDKVAYDFIVSCTGGLFLFALDKPLGSIKKLSNGNGSSGSRLVQLSPSSSWGCGSLLATVSGNNRLSITDLESTRVIDCPVNGDCVAVSWHKRRPILLAATINQLLAVEFNEAASVVTN